MKATLLKLAVIALSIGVFGKMSVRAADTTPATGTGTSATVANENSQAPVQAPTTTTQQTSSNPLSGCCS